MSEELVGTISHYFAKPQVGVVKLTAAIKVTPLLANKLLGPLVLGVARLLQQ